jgi:uncharacterized protein
VIQPEPTPSRILFGPDGLRAGWALLVATMIFFALYYVLGLVLRLAHIVPHQLASPTPGAVLYSEGILFFVVAATSWIMSHLENRPVSTYGLGGHRHLSLLVTGAFWGLLLLSLLVFVLVKSGLLIVDARLLSGGNILLYALAWAPAFLAIALFEEYLFRGYLLFTLTRGLAGLYRRIGSPSGATALGFWTAALLLSFGFGLVHSSNAGESPIGLLAAALISLVFCLSLWRTGSLWWAIGFHAAWDWAESFLYGVADSGITVRFHLFATHPTGSPLLSGGATGPEGSIFVIPVAGLAAAVIALTFRGKAAYAALLPRFNASSPDIGSLPDPVPAPPFEEHRH